MQGKIVMGSRRDISKMGRDIQSDTQERETGIQKKSMRVADHFRAACSVIPRQGGAPCRASNPLPLQNRKWKKVWGMN